MATTNAPATTTRNWLIPLLILVIGMFMSVLDATIVNVAIPTIQRDLGASADDIEWVVTAYSLMLGVVVPVSAWLGLRFGYGPLYAAALVGFALTSGLCGLAWDLPSLVIFRILQAIPGGVLPVVALTMVYQIVPRRDMGTAMGIYGLGIVVAPACGPTLGGYLVEYATWPLIFFVNVPVGILGAIAAVFVLPTLRPASWPRFDWWGFATAAVGLFAMLLAFSEGQSWGWTSYRILILFTVSVLSLALFVVIELERDEPMLDVRVFVNWPFTNSLLLIVVMSVGLFVMVFYVPVFLQAAQGLQPLAAGLTLLPEALMMGLLIPIAGKVYDIIGPRWPATIGMAIIAYGSYLLAGMTPTTSKADIILWTCIRAVGMGTAMIPIMTSGLSALPPASVNDGSALNNVAQRVTAALGLAAVAAFVSGQRAQVTADRAGLLTSADAGSIPGLGAMVQRGVSGVYPLYQQTQIGVLASTYSDTFLLMAIVTAVGVPLALLMRSGGGAEQTAPAEPPASADQAAPAEPAASADQAAPAEPATSDTPASTPARQPEFTPANGHPRPSQTAEHGESVAPEELQATSVP